MQALSPGIFTQHFLESYNEDDTFFLHDNKLHRYNGESLAEAFARHIAAGRVRLANALHSTASTRVLGQHALVY